MYEISEGTNLKVLHSLCCVELHAVSHLKFIYTSLALRLTSNILIGEWES